MPARNKLVMTLDKIYKNCLDLINKNELLEAETHLKKLFEGYPENCEVINTLAICFIRSGKKNDAYDLLYKSLKSNIFNENVLLTFANLLYETEEYTKSLNIFSEGNRIYPENENFLYGMALCEEQLDNVEASLDKYNQLIENNNKDERYFINRSSLYFKLGKFNEVIFDCDIVLEINPKNIQANLNKASALVAKGEFISALKCHDLINSIDPKNPSSLTNKGLILREIGRNEDALSCYKESLKIRPNHPETAWKKSHLDLLLGNWKEGWEGYESRFNRSKNIENYFFCEGKNWRGFESLTGKTIFIQCEQGLGDTIQFSRFLKPLCDQGAEVIISAPQTLFPILERLPINLIIIKTGEIPDKFDFCCPLMSLPYALGVTVENIETPSSYITSNPEKEISFSHLDKAEKLKVGIVCSGRPTHKNDHNRSLSLSLLKPLFDLSCDFHMLQKEYRDDDLQLLDELPNVEDHSVRLNDFSDTATLISKMDLVISVDTSVAHLAGALGTPVWILLPFAPDFRWMLDSTNSPWYQSAVLYRQSSIGQWEDVIYHLKNDLKHKIIRN